MPLTTIRFRNAVALAALASLFCASSAYADTTVVNQPTNLNGSDSSQNDTTSPGGFGNFATTFDNFSLASSANITKLTWVGDYFTGNPSTITAFTVNFYADNAGTPGTLLQSGAISGNANETAIGTDNFSFPYFDYDATLPTSFSAAAGTQYWLSIVPDLAYPPNWGWEQGTGGDASSYQIANAHVNVLTNDMAFSLIASDAPPTPEPGSMALLVGMGVTGLAFVRRRKRASKPA